MNRLGKQGVRVAVSAMGIAAAALGGCASVKKADYDAAVSEALDLRDRVTSLQSDLEQSEADKQELLSRNAELEKALADANAGGGGGSAGPASSGRGGDVVLTVAGDVLFNSGQATLRDEGKRQLDAIARRITSEFASNRVRVEGYTDTDPIRKSKFESNEHLSAMRALSVEKHLVSRGVDKDRIYSAAMGPSNPKGSKKDSRRVEIVILGGN